MAITTTYNGIHHLGAIPVKAVQSMWADACNDVKWRGTAA
jgi:hypothetical protein